MEVNRTYTYRMAPTQGQAHALNRMAGCARFVWNRAVRLTQTYREWGESVPGYGQLCDHLPAWKRAFPFLASDGHSQVLQQKLRDLHQALQAAFDPSRPWMEPPRFKKRGDGDNIRLPQGFELHGDRLSLPKVGRVRFRKSRCLPAGAEVRSIVVSRDGGHWYAHLQIRYTVPDPGYAADPNVLGLDLGVARFLTASDGTVVPALTPRYERLQRRLAIEQRRLARKQRGSSNFRKQKQRVAAVHRKLRRIRADFAHQVSAALAKSHGWIAAEDLNLGGMTQSARGTAEAPSTGVRQKAGLNRSILAQGWGQFLDALAYKLAERGGTLIRVAPAHTTQRCPGCGHAEAANRPSQATFACRACGFSDHADRVGATNVRQRGIEALATA